MPNARVPLHFVLLLGVLLLALPGAALPHAFVVESIPVEGAVLASPPAEVVLRFNARIETPVTQVTLTGGHSARRSMEISSQSGTDRIVIDLPPLAPDTYTLNYRVLASDGHVTEGMLHFTVLKR